ncbi:hypothetical protein BHE74_00023507 [Ensete ventricosum]|nr:hypothetical protein BHE74_00023507 [Ensete ventricosum]RZS01920.1 hypothetical protein BHM03_00031884 [Ensete ventricosum]
MPTSTLRTEHVGFLIRRHVRFSSFTRGEDTITVLHADPIVAGIEDKIAAWTFLPKDCSVDICFHTENGEDIQVLRYEPGQKYDPHYDYFSDKVNIARGGHRIATVLMYLTDVAKGGETVFPSAEVISSTTLFVYLAEGNF